MGRHISYPTTTNTTPRHFWFILAPMTAMLPRSHHTDQEGERRFNADDLVGLTTVISTAMSAKGAASALIVRTSAMGTCEIPPMV